MGQNAPVVLRPVFFAAIFHVLPSWYGVSHQMAVKVTASQTRVKLDRNSGLVIVPTPGQCWSSVGDVGPALTRRWFRAQFALAGTRRELDTDLPDCGEKNGDVSVVRGSSSLMMAYAVLRGNLRTDLLFNPDVFTAYQIDYVCFYNSTVKLDLFMNFLKCFNSYSTPFITFICYKYIVFATDVSNIIAWLTLWNESKRLFRFVWCKLVNRITLCTNTVWHLTIVGPFYVIPRNDPQTINLLRVWPLNPFSTGTVFKRQILTSKDIWF